MRVSGSIGIGFRSGLVKGPKGWSGAAGTAGATGLVAVLGVAHPQGIERSWWAQVKL
jgi:hypothetical protein